MSDEGQGTGWRPLTRPNLSGAPSHDPGTGEDGAPVESNIGRRLNRDGTTIVSPFVRLARTHAFHAAGEASVFVTLAGTLLTIDPNDQRSRILLALVLTMAPFAVVGPLIGPALDRIRGGRRATIAVTLFLRAALMVALISNLESAWFFPIAFVWLVLGKTYSVAKAATVPTTADDDDELVEKNSRLAILSAVAGVAGVIPAAGLYRLFGATPTLWWAALVYMLGLVASAKLPRVIVDDPQTTDDDLDIRSEGVRLASFVMALLRAIVGFVFFLLLFEFVRSELPDLSGVGTAAGAAVKSALGFSLIDEPALPWWKAAIPFALWGFGGFAGNVIAPWFRKRFTEEKMLVGAVGAVAISAIAAVWAGGLSGAALVALIVGGSASAAKLAFDSLVQRDAPGANHGAAFGRFETMFQIAWVVGSLLSVIISFPLRAGFLVIAIATVGLGVFIMQQGPASGGMVFGADPTKRSRLRRRGTSGSQSPAGVGPQESQRADANRTPATVGSAGAGAPDQTFSPQHAPQPQHRDAGPEGWPPHQAAPQPQYRDSGPDGWPSQQTTSEMRPPQPPPAPSPQSQPRSSRGFDAERTDPIAPPSWLSDGQDLDEIGVFVEPNPTPPMGIDRTD